MASDFNRRGPDLVKVSCHVTRPDGSTLDRVVTLELPHIERHAVYTRSNVAELVARWHAEGQAMGDRGVNRYDYALLPADK